jgi:hypothetical protein
MQNEEKTCRSFESLKFTLFSLFVRFDFFRCFRSSILKLLCTVCVMLRCEGPTVKNKVVRTNTGEPAARLLLLLFLLPVVSECSGTARPRQELVVVLYRNIVRSDAP